MSIQKIFLKITLFFGVVGISFSMSAQNPNFHIYLCFGQSNMQGMGPIQNQDLSVDSRFKVFEAIDCPNLNRKKANWYTAVPPVCQCYSLLSPADYFGRTMVANLPDSITVGIISVAIGGCDIRLFDKDIYMDYDSTYKESWFTSIVAGYGWNPYQHLINLAKLAQKDGVIKGILLHQGETNTGQEQWLSYVKKIYSNMLTDLSLKADSVPLLAGELLASTKNCCSAMNPIIKRLPEVIPTSHVISSSGFTGQDEAHFDSPSYRRFGSRYAVQMLSLLKYNSSYAEAECGTVGKKINILSDVNASNSICVGSSENISTPPTDDSKILKINISSSTETTSYLYARLKKSGENCKSLWFKIDNGDFELFNCVDNSSWEWLKLKQIKLSTGEHVISFAFANDNIMLDKIVLKNSEIKPVGTGEEAKSVCNPSITTGLNDLENKGYQLDQNSPNPAIDGKINLSFTIPSSNYVSLKIYNNLGVVIDELAGKKYPEGKHSIEYNTDKLTSGTYFYTLVADKFSATKKVIISTK